MLKEPIRADVVVIGGGVAGSAAALAAARQGAGVVVLTKPPDPEEANTRYAQGGIIYTGPEDSPGLLARDILAAGSGDPATVRFVSREGPRYVREVLIEDLKVPFDRDEADGFEGLHLTREGAHSVPRIIHHRDSTGSAIQHALTSALKASERITHLPGMEALKLAMSDGRCVGVFAEKDGEVYAVLGRRGVILATGGLGALYAHTTNPPAATGDGYTLAQGAGAGLRDLHYVQFHPTSLYAPGSEDGFLVSEAVRGEGGVLTDPDGEEFVDHPQGSLAPRDVVARGIRAMMDRTGSPCAYLDVTHRPVGWFEERFPTIHARLQKEGLDPSREPIPVVPAAHYACGGVETDLSGRAGVEGLWAAGEVANTGLHGHNRLASTSLLEGLVFGWRAGEEAARHTPAPDYRVEEPAAATLKRAPERAWRRLRNVLWEKAGLVRTASGLEEGLGEVDALEAKFGNTDLGRALPVARTVLSGALNDRESRGCHYRSDVREAAVAHLPG